MIYRYLLIVLWSSVSFTASAAPIQLHPDNPHYLLWRGKPTVLISSTEHYGAVLNREFDYVKYLKTLQADGLNLTRTFSGSYCEKPGNFNIANNTLAPAEGQLICPWVRSDQDGYGGGGRKFDLTKWDEAYFARLKDFIRQADRRGIVVELVLFCPNYEDSMWNLGPMNVRNNINGIGSVGREDVYALKDEGLTSVQEQMVRKIVTELKDHDNLYYEICNEPYFGGVTLEWQARIARTIVETETGLGVKHLIAQNIANHRQKIDNPNPLVSIFNFHYARPPVTVSENYGLNRPIGDDETGFDGSEDKTYRREAWNFMLAGGAIFNHLDYSFYVGKEDGTGKVSAPGGGSVAFRKQLGILKRTLEAFDFIHARPVDSIVKKGLPEKATAYSLGLDAKAYLVYLSGFHGPAEVEMALPDGRYQIEWLDTQSGQTTGKQILEITLGSAKVTIPSFNDDIACRILKTQ